MLPFKVERQQSTGRVRVIVHGELDMETGPRAEEEIRRAENGRPEVLILDLREAQLTADVEIRTDKLEEREQTLAELEERLATQERELAAYVAKAQTEIQRRESEWWKQQLGEDAEVSAA